MNPFLTLTQFQAIWDGPPLTTPQQGIVTLLLQVASNWIYQRRPDLATGPQPPTDPTAQLVTFEVVSNCVRYAKFAPLGSFHRATGHRIEAGTLTNPTTALDFTDRHKVMLGIPLRALPMTSCVCNDFNADDQDQGWPTQWSDRFGNLGWDYWQYD